MADSSQIEVTHTVIVQRPSSYWKCMAIGTTVGTVVCMCVLLSSTSQRALLRGAAVQDVVTFDKIKSHSAVTGLGPSFGWPGSPLGPVAETGSFAAPGHSVTGLGPGFGWKQDQFEESPEFAVAPHTRAITGLGGAVNVQSQEDAVFVSWLVNLGDVVEEGDPLSAILVKGKATTLRADSPGVISKMASDLKPGAVIGHGETVVVLSHPAPFFSLYPLLILLSVLSIITACLYFERRSDLSSEESKATACEEQFERLVSNVQDVQADPLVITIIPQAPRRADYLKRPFNRSAIATAVPPRSEKAEGPGLPRLSRSAADLASTD